MSQRITLATNGLAASIWLLVFVVDLFGAVAGKPPVMVSHWTMAATDLLLAFYAAGYAWLLLLANNPQR